MIVVSNTSPLNYLVLIDAVDVLPQLFGSITIPQAVRNELSDTSAPLPVQSWIKRPPDWLQVQAIEKIPDSELDVLHPGEREAILLAEQLSANILFLDELTARNIAIHRKLRVTGTLGILNEAGVRGLLDIPSALGRLRRTTFRAAPSLYKWLLNEDSRRKQRG